MPQEFFPCDLRAGLPEAEFILAGRVIARDAEAFILGDALHAVRVRGAITATEGSFLQALVAPLQNIAVQSAAGLPTTEESGLWMKEVLSVIPCPLPRGDGEFARLANTRRARHLEARARALSAVRSFFEQADFLEIQAPTFGTCPGLDPHVHSLSQEQSGSSTHYLMTSPEFFLKRLLVSGLPRIYSLARVFRAEELGALHEPEFTLLEWYRAFTDWTALLEDTESLITLIYHAVSEYRVREVALPANPFLRMTVREAFQRFAGVEDAVLLAETSAESFFEHLVDKVEPGLHALGEPVFLTHFPACQAALAQLSPEDPTTAERFELYLGGFELSNGYGELTDAALQRARFLAELKRRDCAGEPLYPLDERFLAGLVEGMPPASGNALGFDRALAWALGLSEIAPTLAFSDSER